MARTQIRGNTQIMAGSIGNAEIATDAAIAYSKLDLAGNIDNADIATDAAIAMSKLDLAISNSEVATDAAIAMSKLDLAISDSEVATDAAIAESKIAFDTTDGHDHDGTNSKVVSAAQSGKFDVSRETPTGDVDGTNVDFTLATSPISGSEHIWLNGALQQLGTDADYAIDGAVITFNDAPETDDRIVVSYGTA
jgi:hypothetical protein